MRGKTEWRKDWREEGMREGGAEVKRDWVKEVLADDRTDLVKKGLIRGRIEWRKGWWQEGLSENGTELSRTKKTNQVCWCLFFK
jgi:hypothetical protein